MKKKLEIFGVPVTNELILKFVALLLTGGVLYTNPAVKVEPNPELATRVEVLATEVRDLTRHVQRLEDSLDRVGFPPATGGERKHR